MVDWPIIRAILLAVGWPALVVGSAWMIWRTWGFRRQLGGRRAGGLVMQSVTAWVVASTLLGLAATSLMFADVAWGVQVAIPIFIAWAISMGLMIRVAATWASEARVLEAYYAAHEATDRLKANVLNRFSHAFATPLTPMAAEITLLRSGRLGPITDKQEHALGILQRNQDRLRKVIADAVLAGQVHGRRVPLSMQPVDVGALVHRTASEVLGTGDRRVHVAVPSLQIEADEDRIGYVLRHILRHAIDGPSGIVEVNGRAYRDEVEITVQYASEADPVAAFGLLDESAEVAPTEDAMELGLFTARGLIELHGGTLQVGREHEDVMIAIRLPAVPPQALIKTPALASKE